MPETNKKDQETSMLDHEQVLFDNVLLPAFVEKCATLGVELPDGESVKAALDIAAMVKNHVQQNAGNSVKKAALALRNEMGIKPEPKRDDVSEARVKEAGVALSQVPEIRAAIDAMAS